MHKVEPLRVTDTMDFECHLSVSVAQNVKVKIGEGFPSRYFDRDTARRMHEWLGRVLDEPVP